MKLSSELKKLLVDWKEEEKHLEQLAKSRPEYRAQYLAEQTGMMRHRVELEELLRRNGIHYPRTDVFEGELDTDEHKKFIDIN